MATSSDRDRVILAETIAKCWQDPEFKSKFALDPATYLRQAGMDVSTDTRVHVFENSDSVTYLGLASSVPIEDYQNVIEAFVKSQMPMKPGQEIRFVQSEPDYLPIIIPVPPHAYVQGELTDAELMSMAGGDYLWEATNVATTTQAVAEANAAAVQNVAGATEAIGAAEAVAAAVIACCLI